MTKNIVLAKSKECTGCAACANICTHDAISMVEDENGFKYPQINGKKCRKCGLCQNNCSVINVTNKTPQKQIVYAAVGKNSDDVKTSSSGGIFPLLAENVLDKNGTVYGCAIDQDMRAFHTVAYTKEELVLLKGSKYIQSDIGNTYRQVEKDLNEGRKVLLSGTPCQVAGLKAFLRKDYSNLITVDLVCHGVPSYSFFKQYIDWYENKKRVKILDYVFRDKTKTDMGCVARIRYLKNGKERTTLSRYNANYYYYYYYMLGKIYRRSCYSCPYANLNRLSDVTLGDFWGINNLHPEIDIQNGMSVVILNTEKGKELFDEIDTKKYPSTIDEAVKYNRSIISSVDLPPDREEILRLCREEGGYALEKYFRKDVGIRQLVYSIKWLIPVAWKRKIKAILHRR